MNEDDEYLAEQCNAIFWYRIQPDLMQSKYILAKTANKASAKTSMGYKYNIIIFKESVIPSKTNTLTIRKVAKDTEIFSAIIGDVFGYVEQVGSLGYSGIIYKIKSQKIYAIKHLIHDMLSAFGFDDKQIKNALKLAM